MVSAIPMGAGPAPRHGVSAKLRARVVIDGLAIIGLLIATLSLHTRLV
jgi:hypothetical protein